MAEDREADSSDESASAARPDDARSESQAENDAEALEEHVAPEDAREPTVEELEQLLESDDDGTTDGDSDGDPEDPDAESAGELVSVGAATGHGAEGDSSPAKKARSKKDRATPKQKQPVEKAKRTTPVSFTKEAVGELRKVVYPTASQLGNYFLVVLVFVLIIIGFVSLLDLGFGWVIVKVFS